MNNAHWFEVSLGFATVQVEGATISEAIDAARKRLCVDLPRMWDVIQSLDSQRFQVRLLPGS